ncbi:MULTISPECIES: 4-hydroxybenzoate octaprenyltransferase [Acidiplasma]|jgi:4-hydroxybenzoate polyprenyltransferase|uniref:Prenyltransferase n=3 Tax=Acidiplasma TaxID=507753 RepID=A0A0Q0VJ89_9ARCH|nr:MULTISPECIES: 4-hydroxybenzoate octaprenyltransferase [Acidiplasma]KJE48929.1 prenyltransferase [Acidiplasma sp. MBA-1]KPV47586.1 prenyltransferase [Acidiplasma aeolicum]KQB33577.1 prenyltransferase [Acidiplasma cupricumulans]KQB36542.1 prenyltransferase [Acidiplasma aeolicum]WMT54345.1 MAG: 4-hydroxybenzoate octaprenyltransferase [Acidiplasma sp.]
MWDPGGAHKTQNKVYITLRFLRMEQTFFSLPMAYLGAFLAVRGIPSIRVLLLIFTALFFIRIAGMTNDNLADRFIDARNPRTMTRPLVTGAITVQDAYLFIIIGLIGYFVSAFFINIIAFTLSPLGALIIMTYPYMKRHTALANYQIASIQGLSVMAGAIAASGIHGPLYIIYRIPWFFVFATIFWAIGFDLYNHIPDIDYDKTHNLHSFAVLLGGKSLAFAGLNQVLSVSLAVGADIFYKLYLISYISTALHGLIMLIAFILARKQDYGRAFHYNIYASVVLALGIIIDAALGFPKF